jgi:hypothetical protein
VSVLRSWIQKIPVEYQGSTDPELVSKKNTLMTKWYEYVYLARKKPQNKSPNFFSFKVSQFLLELLNFNDLIDRFVESCSLVTKVS